jgi:hypothetical protein
MRPELDESRRLKRIRSEAGDINLSQVYIELIELEDSRTRIGLI